MVYFHSFTRLRQFVNIYFFFINDNLGQLCFGDLQESEYVSRQRYCSPTKEILALIAKIEGLADD